VTRHDWLMNEDHHKSSWWPSNYSYCLDCLDLIWLFFVLYIYIYIKVQEDCVRAYEYQDKYKTLLSSYYIHIYRSLDLLYCCSLNWRKLWHDEGATYCVLNKMNSFFFFFIQLVFCNRPPDIINAVNDIPSTITTFHAGYSVKYTCLTGYVG